MRHPSSVYSSVRLQARTRRALVAVLAAVAVLLGLAAPALASGGHAASAATTLAARQGGLATGSFRPLVNRVSGGSISGHVTLPTDTGFSDRFVTVRAPGFVRTVQAGADGDYQVRGLDAGSYRVTFNRVSGYATLAAQFYNGHDESAGVGSAERVAVAAGQDVDSINATLRAGGHFTGRLVGPTGQGLTCVVQAYTTDQSLVTRYVYTYPDGTFDLTGLTTGAYHLRVLSQEDCTQGVRYLGTGTTLTTTGPGAPRSVIQGGTTAVGTFVYGTPVVPLPPVVTPPAPAPTFAVTHKAKVAGPAVVGEKVKVKLATLSPTPSKVTFQWLRNGHQIKQAKHRSYEITRADAGKRLAVKVVYERPGYPDLKVITKVGRVHAPMRDRLLPVVTGLF